MTPKAFYKKYGRRAATNVAESSGTTFLNFKQIALANGAVSSKLAEKLAKNSGGKMTEMEILYPERYSCDASENETDPQAA